MTKSDLRKLYLQKQGAFSPELRAEKSRAIAARFFGHVELGGIKAIHCFIPIEKFNEIDTMFIFQRLWREYPGIDTVVPRVDIKTGEMRSLKYSSETGLIKNVWEISEPEHNETIEPGEIDMVVVPLLCCDTQGHRVGYGKGFYDRFLVSCRPDCLKIGLSYFPPVSAIDDIHEGDVRLDMCVWPEDFRRTVTAE